MAWSPARRSNARQFEVEHPGDYATLNSNQPRDRTVTRDRATPISNHFRDGTAFIVVRYCTDRGDTRSL